MHQEKIINFCKKHFVVLLVIGIGIILRLIRLWDLFHFTYDEEVFAFVGKRMFVNGHIPLIGGVTPFHVHVAPYFYWLSGILLYLSKLNPIGWGIIAVVIAAITMIVLYHTTRNFFGTQAARIALIFYSFSFYQNIFDRHYWGLVFDGLIALLAVFSLTKMIRGKEKYIYLLSGILAFGIHTDLSMLSLVVLAGITFIYFRPRIEKKSIIKSLLFFGFSFIPLIVFDIRHQFSNSKGFLQYLAELQKGGQAQFSQTPLDIVLFVPRVLIRLLHVFGDTDLAKMYSYCAQYATERVEAVPVIAAAIILVVFTGLFYKFFSKTEDSYQSIGMRIILLAFTATYLGVVFYGSFFRGDIFDHYLSTLFPLFFILLGYVGAQIWQKSPTLIAMLLIIFTASNVMQLFNVQHRFGYANKIQAVQWAIAQTEITDFSLDVIGSCFAYNGYRYLFYLYGKEPVKSYVDVNFTYLYDQPPAEKHPPYLIVITNPDFTETSVYTAEYEKYKQAALKSAQFGAIEVLLINNTAHPFVGKF